MLSSFFRRPRVFVLAGIAFLAVIAGGVYLVRSHAVVTPALTYSEFLQQIDRGVALAVMSDAELVGAVGFPVRALTISF